MNGHPALFKTLGLVGLACLISGCTIPRYLWSQADHKYTAVSVRSWENPPAGQHRTIRVLLVHGMSNYPFGGGGFGAPQLFGAPTYAALQRDLRAWENDPAQKSKLALVIQAAVANGWESFIDNSAQKLGHPKTSWDEEHKNEFKLVHDASGNPSGYTFTRAFGANKNGVELKFYVANWGLGAAVMKEKRFGTWQEASESRAVEPPLASKVKDFDPRLNPDRAWLNKLLKTQTMDWGLGDAAIYLGEAGQSFQEPVRAALNQLLREAGPNDRVAVVAASLGSTITLDTLIPFLRSEVASVRKSGMAAPAGKMAMLSRPSETEGVTPFKPSGLAFYMFANQYGLLKIGEEEKSFRELDEALRSTRLSPEKSAMQVYAFTDPNDLLSYPLKVEEKSLISVCNVFVRNPAVTVGFFMEPLEAHVNYEQNGSVLDAILNGPSNVQVLPKKRRGENATPPR